MNLYLNIDGSYSRSQNLHIVLNHNLSKSLISDCQFNVILLAHLSTASRIILSIASFGASLDAANSTISPSLLILTATFLSELVNVLIQSKSHIVEFSTLFQSDSFASLYTKTEASCGSVISVYSLVFHTPSLLVHSWFTFSHNTSSLLPQFVPLDVPTLEVCTPCSQFCVTSQPLLIDLEGKADVFILFLPPLSIQLVLELHGSISGLSLLYLQGF